MKVSVWAGTTPSWEVLDGHLTFTFTEDGIAIPCRFCHAFDFDWFDEDFREASCGDKATLSVGELLKRHSHGDEIAQALGKRCSLAQPCNAVVLLYDFDYSQNVESASVGGNTNLHFLGCVEVG